MKQIYTRLKDGMVAWAGPVTNDYIDRVVNVTSKKLGVQDTIVSDFKKMTVRELNPPRRAI